MQRRTTCIPRLAAAAADTGAPARAGWGHTGGPARARWGHTSGPARAGWGHTGGPARARWWRGAVSLLAAALAALALGACGESHTRVTTGTYAGSSGKNAPYLDVGPLVYQVQISRELNPYNTEDAQFLMGLSPAESNLNPGEEWFGVFVQVFNESTVPHPAATDFTVSDTQGKVYRPIVPGPTNLFAYRGGVVPANDQIPAPNTVAANGPTQGLLLLYKIKLESLDNRPLTLEVVDPRNPTQTASAELDV